MIRHARRALVISALVASPYGVPSLAVTAEAAPAMDGTMRAGTEPAGSGTRGGSAATVLLIPDDASPVVKPGHDANVPRTRVRAAESVAISISPANAALDACKALVVSATVTGAANANVIWTVTEAGGGRVVNGIYTAPRAPGIYHVVATSVADPMKAAQGTIAVGPEKVLSVGVTPESATVKVNGSLTFEATVTTSCGTYPAHPMRHNRRNLIVVVVLAFMVAALAALLAARWKGRRG